MTRIYTNVSSLTAQNSLQRSNASLQQALTRLSTGLRINVGKDDPAGLIASEALKSDITSVGKAISNSQRANEMIATADSALGQVGSLLNDIRGLVTEAANTGAMSADQIAANQLQVDSSLDAINRISQVTSFQGKRLLDGSLDFITENWTNPTDVTDMQINSASLGQAAALSVDVNVDTAATQGVLKVAIDPTGGSAATSSIQIATGDAGKITVSAPGPGLQYDGITVKFVKDADTATGTPTASYNVSAKELVVNVNSTGSTALSAIETAIERDTTFTAVVDTAGFFNSAVDNGTDTKAGGTITFADGTIIQLTAATAGASYDANVAFTEDSGGAGVVIDWATGVQNVKLAAGGNTAAEILAAFNTDTDSKFTAVLVHNGGTGYSPTADNGAGVPGVKASATLSFLAGASLVHVDGAGTGTTYESYSVEATNAGDSGSASAAWTGNKLTVTIYDDSTMQDIVDAVNDQGGVKVAAWTNQSAGAITADEGASEVALSGGVDAERQANIVTTGGFDAINADLAGGGSVGGLAANLVFQLSGSLGTQVFNFDAGASGSQLETALNLVQDATGVSADWDSGTNVLYFNSVGRGSDAFVNVDVVSEGTGGDFADNLENDAGNPATRSVGADIIASVNGVTATGSGNTLSVNNSTLSISLTAADNFEGHITFDITGGGAQFQLGPDVVSNQQARIGVMDVNSASLSGADGRLYTLGSGEDNSLTSDPTTASLIVDEVINKVTSLRGRLGAFQKATLESNIASLTDTQENLTAAQSAIRDADFAAESANLTRGQILVQAGTSVLAIANQNPQNVLSLLR